MNRIELQVNKMPLIFTGKSVTYENKEFFYNEMEAIKHINNDTPALMFTYDGQSVQIPYDPSDKSIMEQIFKEITAVSRSAKETQLSPSQEELNALFAGLQTPKQATPPQTASPHIQQSQSQRQPQQNYKHTDENTTKYSKTKICNTCGKRIAKSANRCPHCGAKNAKSIYKRWWFIILFIIVILGVAGAIGGNSDTDTNTGETTAKNQKETTAPTEKVLTISPDILLSTYEENEVKGDELYIDKNVRLTGVINDIGKDIAEDVYITFKTKDEYSITSVQCYFSDDKEIKKVMNLKPNQQITVIGRCDGKFANVFIKDCKIE